MLILARGMMLFEEVQKSNYIAAANRGEVCFWAASSQVRSFASPELRHNISNGAAASAAVLRGIFTKKVQHGRAKAKTNDDGIP
ncbi:hypothetical protein ACVWZL_000628 [Bradyrhizobium sp. GM2.4]